MKHFLLGLLFLAHLTSNFLCIDGLLIIICGWDLVLLRLVKVLFIYLFAFL